MVVRSVSSPLVRDPDPRDPAAGPLAAAPEAPSPGGARTAEAVIDLAAIAGNLRIFREHTDAPVLAVVKADGYGHGAVQVARTALAHGASWLGVSFIAEALALRAAGIQAPILAFTHLPDEDVTQAVLADIDLSVSTEAQLEAIAQSAGRLGRTAQVHVELDTGLHHNGASPAQWPDLVAAAARLEAKGTVHVRGLWSHLVHPDEPEHPTTLRQLDDFEAAIAQAEQAGLTGRIAHLASSAAVLTIPRSHHGLVRIGRGLYGVEPVRERSFGLVPPMTLRGRLGTTRRVEAGEGVSDEHRYQTTEPGTLAVVPLGYADGLPRAASIGAEVWIDGARRPVAGWITMNSFVADLGQSEAEAGDEVVLFGPGSLGEPTIAEWAGWAGTNPHEVMTRIGPRVPRRYLGIAESSEGVAATRQSGREGADRLRVIVLFGGPGGEYDISCASGATIITHLDRERYQVQPVRISPERRWIPGPADFPAGEYEAQELIAATPDPAVRTGANHEPALAVLANADVVIPALHGPFGEDGTVQALMDVLGVRYVGSGMQASVLGMDKDAAKRVLTTSGLDVAEWALLRKDEEGLSAADRERLGLPVFVKPARSGSSVGVSRVKRWEELEDALAGARKWDDKVLVERSVIGREINVAVLEFPDGRIEASAPLETVIVDGVHEWRDYAIKYQEHEATHVLLPAPLDPELTAELQRQAIAAFEILGCKSLARVDFLLRGGVEPVFNEINTFPGFSASSLFAKLWAYEGLALPELLDVMVETVLARVPSLH
jgi:alanine racemase